MTIKRKDFQKAAALIHEFQLKLSEEGECAELRDALNLALLHMQRYYRYLRSRITSQEKVNGQILTTSLRGLSPMTPFKDAPDRFQWKWVNLDSSRLRDTLPPDVQKDMILPPLLKACKEGDNAMVMQVLDQDTSSLDQIDGLGRSALMYSVHFGQLDTMQILLEQAVSIDHTAHDGSTSVHLACHEGNHEALRILVEYNADLNIQDTQGRAPIHWAAANKHTACLELLLDQDVAADTRDKDGMTPAMWACRMDNIDHFGLLTEVCPLPADGDYERDNNGRSWMHWSIRRTEPLECLKTLLTAETATLRDDEGKTVMHTSTDLGSLPACRVILEIAGSSVLEDRDSENRTPLILATMAGHGEVVNHLLSEGADLACVDNNGATAWDYARGRQLHYCMLILASYIRQRAKDGGDSVNSFELNGDIHGIDHIPMNRLQIHAESEESYQHTFPITSPHPPDMPPSTPRSARQSRPRTPGSHRRIMTSDTPYTTETTTTPNSPPSVTSPMTPRAPSTPRSFGRKRSPMQLDHNDESPGQEHSDRSSSAGKRKKNEHEDSEPVSVISVGGGGDSRHESIHMSPPGNADHSDGGVPADDDGLEHESVSISAMDVSDLEASGPEDEEAAPPAAPLTARSTARYQWKQTPSPRHQHSAQGAKSLPGPPNPPPRLMPPGNPLNRRRSPSPVPDEDEDDQDDSPEPDEPSVRALSPSMLRPISSDSRSSHPPAHLSPLPPSSPTKKKKKKKKKDKPLNQYDLAAMGQQLAPVAAPGGLAPVSGPVARSRDQSPSPPRPASAETPSSGRDKPALLSPRSSGGSGSVQHESRYSLDPPVAAERTRGGSRSPSPSPRVPVLPQAQPRAKLGRLEPSSASSQSERGRHNDSDRRENRPSPAPRTAPPRSDGAFRNLNGQLSGGSVNLPKDPGKGYKPQGRHSSSSSGLVSSASKKKARSLPPPSPRQRKPNHSVPPINQKLANGRPPPSY